MTKSKYIKLIAKQPGGWTVNNKVFIDINGTLWNSYNNKTPYKEFPKYYFTLRDNLISENMGLTFNFKINEG